MQKKIILGVTVGGSSRLLDGQVSYFIEKGYEVYLMSPDHFKEHLFCEREGCIHLPVAIEKEISPVKDLKAISQIVKHLKAVKPDIVNVGTPKMGLLGLIGAKIAGVKNRIYTCRGLRYETETGVKLKILKAMEKLSVKLSVKTIYVSPSSYKKSLKDNIADEKKAVIIGKGSSNGVDINTFDREKVNTSEREQLVEKYNLSGKIVIGFVGRVSQHKGAFELVDAFEEVYKLHPDTRLIMMGHIDCPDEFKERYETHPGVIHIPFQDKVALYMSLFDIFVLPSWREGFPNVPIQAAAMGLPVIVSNATGCVDAVNEGYNGLVFQKKKSKELKKALLKYVENSDLRKKHGANGRLWAENFTSTTIWDGLEELYKELL